MFATGSGFGDEILDLTFSYTNSLSFLSLLPTGDLGLLAFTLSLSIPGENPLVPLLRSPKSNEPFLIAPLNADESVLLKLLLYGSWFANASLVKLSRAGTIFICSSKLELYFGLIVLPSPPPYFSPDGDLGGVSPFYVGEFGCFCIFVMNKGDGGAISVYPGYPESSSVINFLMRVSVVL